MADAAYWRRQVEAFLDLHAETFGDATVEPADGDEIACHVSVDGLDDDTVMRLKIRLNRGGIETTGDDPLEVWCIDEQLPYPYTDANG